MKFENVNMEDTWNFVSYYRDETERDLCQCPSVKDHQKYTYS